MLFMLPVNRSQETKDSLSPHVPLPEPLPFLPLPSATLASFLLIEWASLCTCCSLCLIHLAFCNLHLSLNVTSERPPLTYLSKVSPPLFPLYFLMSVFYFCIVLFTIRYSLCVYLSIVSVLHESRAGTVSCPVHQCILTSWSRAWDVVDTL